MKSKTPGWPAFIGWLVVGVGFLLGLLTIFTIGWMVDIATAALVLLLLIMKKGGSATTGLISGAGMPLLLVAYLNRQGPGTICHSLGQGSECTEEWNPLPWLTAGVLLLVAGAVLFAVLKKAGRKAVMDVAWPTNFRP